MMPVWKVKRELKRPLDQIRALVRIPFDQVTKWQHDRLFHSRIVLTQGEHAIGKKVAIFLIYQPKGLTHTTLLTCRHLLESGYSVLVVSNTLLSDESRARLAPLSWQILERPNIGYDFGGYRDGLRILHEAQADLQALVVMNDSIWWPLCANDQSLQNMEQLGVDVTGMIMRPPGKPRKRASNRASHLQSYFYWFGPRVLVSQEFADFWKQYSLSSFKYNAIRQGELQLTKTLMDAGFSVAPLYSFETLMEKLESKPNDYLRKVLHYSTSKDTGMARNVAALAASTTENAAWRAAVFEIFRQMNIHSEFHLALRFPSVDLLKLNFLKRSSAEPKKSMHHIGRSKYLEAIANGDLPAPMPDVLLEIKERHRVGAAAVGR